MTGRSACFICWLLLLALSVSTIHALRPLVGSRRRGIQNYPLPSEIYHQQRQRKYSTSSSLHYRNRPSHEQELTTTRVAPTSTSSNNNRGQLFTSINTALIRHISLSQISLLAIATALTVILATPEQSFSIWRGWSFQQLGVGFLATVPMILSFNQLERSVHRDASHVHFRTTNLVITLFGRRRRPAKEEESPENRANTNTAQVVLFSTLVTSLTAVTEEVIFRGYLPILLAGWPSLTTWLVQAILFGLGHMHADNTAGANRLVATLHTIHGLWLGILVGSCGSLLPAILAHWIYGMHVLCSTWHTTNNQIDWAEQPHEISSTDHQQLQHFPHVHFLRRFFYAFDTDHQGSLSLANVQRAVAYAFLGHPSPPSAESVQIMVGWLVRQRPGPPRLSLPEFCTLLSDLKQQSS